MDGLLGWIRGWRLALALCVLALICGGAGYVWLFGAPSWLPFGGAASGGLAADERLIPVRQGSLMNEISVNGSIAFTNKQDLNFGSAGFVDEILVTEGEVVSEGQALARLNPESVANLQRAVAEARLERQTALNALHDAQTPTLATAEAQAAVTDAGLELKRARDDLDALVNPEAQAVAEAEAAVANAALELEQARDDLDALVNPEAQAVAQAEEAVAQARVNLQESEDAVGSSYADAATELAAAQREHAAAQEGLNAAQDSSQLKTAQDAFDQEERDYINVIEKWTGAEVTPEERLLPSNEVFAALDFRPDEVFKSGYVVFPDGRFADNPATRWNELTIFGWRWLYPGAASIEVDCEEESLLPARESDTTNTNAELCIGRDMQNAYDALQTARDALAVEQAQRDERALNATLSVERAETALADAREKVAGLESGSARDALLRRQFAAAQENLAKTEDDLAKLINPDAADVASKRGQVALAEAKLAKAKDDLADLLNPDAAEVAAKRGQAALAEAKLSNAMLELERLQARAALDVTLQELSVAAAQVKVDGAIRRYDESTLSAPWDGYVSAVNVEVGKEVEAFETIMQVINSGIVEVSGVVDEIDVLELERGEAATVTLDALPDQILDGRVSSVSSTATNERGVVTFDVKILVNVPDGLTLQDGLSAVAKIVSSEQSGLLVPLQAVQQNPDGEFARVMEGGVIVERPITLGNSDGFWAIVESGLSEGDEIVMRVLDEVPSNLGFEEFEEFEDDEDDRPRRRRPPPGEGGGP